MVSCLHLPVEWWMFPLACAELRDAPSPPMHVELVLFTATGHNGLIRRGISFTNDSCAPARPDSVSCFTNFASAPTSISFPRASTPPDDRQSLRPAPAKRGDRAKQKQEFVAAC
jgi:hypothetical protein